MEALGLLGFGVAVGFYGTLVGIGGGPLLVPMLALFYELPPATIVATSLSVIFLNALSGSVAYYQQRRVDVVSGTLFGMATVPSSIAAYFLLAHVGHTLFERIFGVFLLALAGYVMVGRAPTDEPDRQPATGGYGFLGPRSPRRLVDTCGHVYLYEVDERLGQLVNVAFGAGSTVLGIGGGILQVPALAYTLDMPVRIATATAHYITALTTFFALLPLLYFGHADLRLVAYLGGGAVLGAHAGAHLSRRVSTATLMHLLAAMLLATALGTFARS